MKQIFFSFLFLYAAVLSAYAIPAKPGKNAVRQPDGKMVTLVLHGDEFSHFTTTSDNYTVIQTKSGYKYAIKQNGMLIPSDITAHDAQERTVGEKAFLSTQAKMLRADINAGDMQEMQRSRSLWKSPAAGGAPQKTTQYDYNNFRGLVILVEWNDREFTHNDPKTFFSSMMNDDNYSGYYTQDTPQQWVPCTGSVRDYYSDNSFGLFKPTFDVVGPIKINRSCEYPQGASRGYMCAVSAIEAANSIVDYSQYDADGDGVVDMFYIIYAGYGSNVSGNNGNYIWPYASQYVYPYRKYDGVTMGRYACSTELCGAESNGEKTLDGIGTICHEFSHVLGLPDLYDTDYEENGQSNDPGVWSIMAGGGYNNDSRTPTGYGAYERYAIGFMQPELITEKGAYSLEAINTSNTAYRINSAVDKEYFLLENRQKTRWDEYLPGSGMLISRVDSTNASVWTSNTVNCDPSHNYYELLRANPNRPGSDYDPFPGRGNVTEINNDTDPSLKSWTGAATSLAIGDIRNEGGVISFNVGSADDIRKEVEDFEAMELTDGDATGVQGVFCKWDMVKAKVIQTTEEYGTGNKALGIVRGGILTSSAMKYETSTIEFDFWNATSANAIIRTSVSTDGGNTWSVIKNSDGQTQMTVGGKKNVHARYIANLPAGCMIRIQQTSGLPTEYCYIDNISVLFKNITLTGISHISADSNAGITGTELYNISGQRVAPGTKGILIRNGKKYISK